MSRVHVHVFLSTLITVGVLLATHINAEETAYDPLTVSLEKEPATQEFVVDDTARKRDIPLLVYLPMAKALAPVILFSHGLGGSRNGSSYLGKHWAARGYVAVFLQHPGSDGSVWKGKRLREIKPAMKAAASAENFLLRVGDMPAVLDQLTAWNATDQHVLKGRLDMTKVGLSGHSFGAITTQAVCGQGYRGKAPYLDSRIIAAVIMSPSSPSQGSAETAFGSISMPWMLMTGTKDVSPIGNATVASRLAVFPALPEKGKYELVLFDGEHNAFTDGRARRNAKRNPNHHKVVLALSAAFWDAYLRKDAKAREWLDGIGSKAVLGAKDTLRKK